MLSSKSGFSSAGRVYLWAVIGAGVVVVLGSIYRLYEQQIGNQWFILAALTLGSLVIGPFAAAAALRHGLE